MRKHARPSQVDGCLRYEPTGAELTVDNVGTALSPISNCGYGLTGMRERAELIGGSLEVGPTPTGYRVRLWVPSGPRSTDLRRAN